MTQDVKERAKLIGHMLDEVEISLDENGRTNDFIESLREQFTEWGTLTDGQLEGLRKFYERI